MAMVRHTVAGKWLYTSGQNCGYTSSLQNFIQRLLQSSEYVGVKRTAHYAPVLSDQCTVKRQVWGSQPGTYWELADQHHNTKGGDNDTDGFGGAPLPLPSGRVSLLLQWDMNTSVRLINSISQHGASISLSENHKMVKS